MGRFKPFTIKPTAGGALVNVCSAENVGAENYTEKVNFRRVVDREVRREGWTYFNPNEVTDIAGQRLAALAGYAITGVAEAVRANGDRLLIALTKDKVFRFEMPAGAWVEIGSGYSMNGRRWEVVPINGELILNNGVDLPFTISVGFPYPRPIWELRERGVASVGTIAEYFGFLHCFDIREIHADDLNAWMNGATPYGPVPDSLCNRIRYRHIWSEYGRPREWAPVFAVELTAATATLTLPFPSKAFTAGATRVAVVNGGINGGTLGGETGYETGIMVTAVNGASITLEKPTALLSYPRTVQVCRFADTSSIVGYKDLTDDGSAVLKALPLRDSFILYRETGIFIGRYTATLEDPFQFRRAFRGKTIHVPYYHDTLVDLDGTGHIFADRERFYLFDGVDEPKVYQPLELSRARFFATAGSQGDPFAVHQPQTGEIWFCTPAAVLAYDVATRTCSEIDATVEAAATIADPLTRVHRFVMATGGALACYGKTYTRYGVGVAARIVSGMWAMADEHNEKEVRAYVLLLSSTSAPISLVITMDSTNDLAAAPTRLFSETTVPGWDGYIPLYFVGTYFRDTIEVPASAGEKDVQISGRTIEACGIATYGVGRSRQ